MGTGYKCALAGLTIAALSAFATTAATAQAVRVVPVPLQAGTIPDRFERAFYANDGDYFRNRTFLRQVALIIGPYSDVEIYQDARQVDQAYRDTLARQLSVGPLIRTADLPTPFNQTVGTLPSQQVIVAPVQPPVIERIPPVTPIPPVRSTTPRQGPVPALW